MSATSRAACDVWCCIEPVEIQTDKCVGEHFVKCNAKMIVEIALKLYFGLILLFGPAASLWLLMEYHGKYAGKSTSGNWIAVFVCSNDKSTET